MSAERRDLPAVVEHGAPVTASTLRSSLIVPPMIAEAGDRAVRRFLDFFAASIENDNTRMAYYRAVCSFFLWFDQHGLGELADIEPFHVAAYLKALRVSDAGDPAVKERTASRPTVKQHLAAIRMLFDWLVVGQVLAINPAHAVRGPNTSSSAAKRRCSARSRPAGCSPASRSGKRSRRRTGRKRKCRCSSVCATAR